MRSVTLAKYVVFMAAFPLLLFSSDIRASDETVDMESWIYPAFMTLELAGLVDLPARMPWTRSEAEFFLYKALQALEDGEVVLTGRQEFLLDRLKGEFHGKGSRPAVREDGPLWCMREGARFAAFDLSAGVSARKTAYRDRGELAAVAVPEFMADLGRGLTLVASYRARLEPELDANRSGEKPSPREKSFRGMTSEYLRGYMSVTGNRWVLLAGRDYLHWGPGREEGLVMSRTAGSIDQFSAGVRMGRFRLGTVHAVLDPDGPRRLAGHRLEISLPGRIRLGVSESVVYTGRSFDFSYLVPVGSYYANQYNERDDDNILWGVDWKIPLHKGFLVRGEVLVDDFQYEDRGTAPDRLAFDIGCEALVAALGHDVEISAGYTYVDIFTYAHKDSLLTRYVTGNGDPLINTIIGSPLGPDSDRWNLRVSTAITPRLIAEIRLALTRRGEGNDFREWDRIEDPDPVFPSGEVVTAREFRLGGSFDLGKGSAVFGGAGISRLSEPGTDGDGSFAYLGMVLDF